MARAPYVALHVAPTGRRATAADIVASVQREIASGALPAGSRLPPVRALEAQLGLSKNTAQAAYDELDARGLIEAREREGVFVLASEGVAALSPVAPVPLPSLVPQPMSRNEQAPIGMFALSTVFIDPALLPTERIADCARSVLRERMPAHYDVQGYRPLREAIAKRLDARGLDVAWPRRRVVITDGPRSNRSISSRARSRSVASRSRRRCTRTRSASCSSRSATRSSGLHLDPFKGLDLAQWGIERHCDQAVARVIWISELSQPDRLLVHERGIARRRLDLSQQARCRDPRRRLGLRHAVGRRVSADAARARRQARAVRQLVHEEAAAIAARGLRRRASRARADVGRNETALDAGATRGSPKRSSPSFSIAATTTRTWRSCKKRSTRATPHALAALDELMLDDVRWTRPGGGPTLWLELPKRVDFVARSAWPQARRARVQLPPRRSPGPAHLHGFRLAYAYLLVVDDARGARNSGVDATTIAMHRWAVLLALAACSSALPATADFFGPTIEPPRGLLWIHPGMTSSEAMHLVPGLHEPDRKGVRDELIRVRRRRRAAHGQARRRHGVGHRRGRARPHRARLAHARVGTA